MSEEDKKLFGELFGEMVSPEAPQPNETKTDTPSESTSEDAEPSTTEAKEETPSNIEEKAEETSDDEKKSDDNKKKEPFPKKDLGVGGASFADEILRHATPEMLAKIKSGEKTMAGCWNWVYSYVKNEYTKNNGRTSGGIFYDCAKLVERYFSEIPEGTVVEEEKPKYTPPSKPDESAKKVVETVAKKAAKAAKRTRKAKSVAKKPEDEPIDLNDNKNPFDGFDWSSLS